MISGSDLANTSRYTTRTSVISLLTAVMEEETATIELFVDHQTFKGNANGLVAPNLATRNATRAGGWSPRILISALRRQVVRPEGMPSSVARVFTPSTPTNATMREEWPQTYFPVV